MRTGERRGPHLRVSVPVWWLLAAIAASPRAPRSPPIAPHCRFSCWDLHAVRARSAALGRKACLNQKQNGGARELQKNHMQMVLHFSVVTVPPTTTKPSSRLHISLPSTQSIPSHPKSPLSHLQQRLLSLRTITFLHTHTHAARTACTKRISEQTYCRHTQNTCYCCAHQESCVGNYAYP